jgi:site-specific DNA-methyltransferase (adenine-specific)
MTLLINDDAQHALRLMLDQSANLFVTSPPYYMQRDYEVPGQVGREGSVQEYLERLWPVFDQARRVLTDDGLCVVNLGDKYLDGCLQLIPQEFAVGMKKRGWIPLNDITWHKTNYKGENVKSRFGSNGEAIFVFAKSRRHYFKKLYQQYSPKTIKRCRQFVERGERFDPARHKQDKHMPSQAPMLVLERIAKKLVASGRFPEGADVPCAGAEDLDLLDSCGCGVRSVWSMATAQCRDAHFATWPPKLVRRLVLACCPPGGTVVDPFVGVGTTLVVVEDIAEDEEIPWSGVGIGIDLNAEYLEFARRNVLAARAERAAAREKAARTRSRSGRQVDR